MLSKLSSIILRLIKSDKPILNETTIAFEKEFLLIIDFLTSSDRDPILKFIYFNIKKYKLVNTLSIVKEIKIDVKI